MDAMRPCAPCRVPIRLYVNQLLEAVLRPDTTAVLSIFMDEVQVKQTRALACGPAGVCVRVRCVFFVFFVCACA